MSTEVVLWIIGAIVTVLSLVCGYLANRQNATDAKLAALAQHVAENYVRGHEIARVERAVSDLRQELTLKVDELLKAVHEMLGRQAK